MTTTEIAEPVTSITMEAESSQVTFSVELVTSKDAAGWLEEYKGPNRKISEGRVLQYQSDMESGRWHFDGMPIRFSSENRLLDGQHRLTALASCVPELSIPFLIVRGLDPDTQLVMDQGGTRTAGQQLALKGTADSNVIASMTKTYLDWSRNRYFKSAQRAGTTKPEIVDWVFNHEELIAKVNATAFRKVDAPATVVGAFALATIQFAPARTHRFLQLLSTGVGLQEGDPILALDRRLRNIRRDRRNISHREYLAYFIRAWNAWVSGNHLNKILIRELTAESFPALLRVADITTPETPAEG